MTSLMVVNWEASKLQKESTCLKKLLLVRRAARKKDRLFPHLVEISKNLLKYRIKNKSSSLLYFISQRRPLFDERRILSLSPAVPDDRDLVIGDPCLQSKNDF